MKWNFLFKMTKMFVLAAIAFGWSSCSKDADALAEMSPSSASGQRSTNSGYLFFDYYIGDGTETPTAQSGNGKKIDLSGAGYMEVYSGLIYGEGIYSSSDPGVGSGSWHAVDIVSFQNYGDSPSICEGFGGKAVIKIVLDKDADGTPDGNANLTMSCCSGNSPSGCDEGIRVNTSDINFNTEIDGVVIFQQ